MSPPEFPLPPRSRSGFSGPGTESFKGQPRDYPAPPEAPPGWQAVWPGPAETDPPGTRPEGSAADGQPEENAAAPFLSEENPYAAFLEGVSGKPGSLLDHLEDPLEGAAKPLVTEDMASSLRDLGSSLLFSPAAPEARPAAAEGTRPTGSASGILSLSALAEQLSSRLAQPGGSDHEAADLLLDKESVPAPAPASSPAPPLTSPSPAVPLRLPPPPASRPGSIPRPAPGGSPAAIRAAVTGAASPAPAAPPAATALTAPATEPSTGEPPAASRHQGDVFFLGQDHPLLPADPHPESLLTPGTFPEDEPVSDSSALFAGLWPDPQGPAESAAAAASARLSPEPPPLPVLPRSPGFAEPEPLEAENRGLGLLAAGAALIALGIYLACRLPLLWLALEGASPWERALTEAGLILQGTGALAALTLGTGAVLQRRWAPPLMGAAGWLAVLTATAYLAAAGVYLGSDEESPLSASWIGLLLAGLLLPLAVVIYCEKESVGETCREADARPSWTDRHTVPSLMTGLCGAAVALTAAAMLRHQPALPLPDGRLLSGTAAQTAWAAWGGLGLLIILLAARRQAAANWLLLVCTLALGATVAFRGWQGGTAWLDFLRVLGHSGPWPGGAPLPAMLPLLAGLSPVLLLLVLAMARRAFSSPPSL